VIIIEIADEILSGLDCEMGVAYTGEPELVRVSAVDYLTGKT
jgi:hypothetical protein